MAARELIIRAAAIASILLAEVAAVCSDLPNRSAHVSASEPVAVDQDVNGPSRLRGIESSVGLGIGQVGSTRRLATLGAYLCHHRSVSRAR